MSIPTLKEILVPCVYTFKIGDDVKWKKYNLSGKITGQDGSYWVINNALLAKPEELEFGNSDFPILFGSKDKSNKCTCGSSACGSDRHSDWCDLK
jgi:hypothetical protein